MANIKYPIKIKEEEIEKLLEIVNKGIAKARTIKRANILLASDCNMTAKEIAKLYNTSEATVNNVRREYFEKGIRAIERNKREKPPVPAKVDGHLEAKIIALACSEPPQGYSRWSVRLIATKVVELGYIDDISAMTICRTLKKMNLSLI